MVWGLREEIEFLEASMSWNPRFRAAWQEL